MPVCMCPCVHVERSQLLPTSLQDPHTDIPAKFALPHLKRAFTSMRDVNRDFVGDIFSCKIGTVTADAKTLLLSAQY
jgi:hypothetical protein